MARALITSGATRARLDAVRFIMNTSSGAMGAALAVEGLARGWEVDVVHGPMSVVPAAHERLRCHPVPWLQDLEPTLRAMSASGSAYSVVFHAMAVLDYAPEQVMADKRPSNLPWTLKLVPTPKVIDHIGTWFPRASLVGFKLEAHVPEVELRARAAMLARRCGARIVVANLLEWVTAGYRCLMVDGTGRVHAEIAGRENAARWLWDFVETADDRDVATAT